jgi:hypothetical protein
MVVGGRHSWLPTQTERLRRALERAHHFVDDGSGAQVETCVGAARCGYPAGPLMGVPC